MDMASVPAEIRAQAEALLADADRLGEYVKRGPVAKAAKRVGVLLSDLAPRSLQSFREGPTDDAIAMEIKQQFFEKARLQQLCIVMLEVSHAERELQKEREEEAAREEKLSAGFMELLSQVKEKLDYHDKTSKRLTEVVARENEMLRRRREQFDQSVKEFETRTAAATTLKQHKHQQLEQRGDNLAQKIQTVQARKDDLYRRKREELLLRTTERDSKMEAVKNAGISAWQQEKEDRALAREQERAAKLVQAEIDAKAEREALRHSLLEKQRAIQEAKDAAKEQLARDRIVRFMRTRTRLAAAARVRREMEYHQEAVKARLTRDAMKIEALADMRDAMCRARVDKMRTGRIGLDQWRSNTVLERSITPGPGAYRVPTFLEEVRGGVTFLKDVGGSMMDKIVERAAAIPGPSDYKAVVRQRPAMGGTMGKFVQKTTIAEVMHHAANMPGVGDYELPVVQRAVGAGAFTTAAGGSMMELAAKHGASVPGPADYAAPVLARSPQSLDDLRKRFTRAKAKLRVAARFIAMQHGNAFQRAAAGGGTSGDASAAPGLSKLSMGALRGMVSSQAAQPVAGSGASAHSASEGGSAVSASDSEPEGHGGGGGQ